MLNVHWITILLFLHALAATIWVGGQLTLAGLVPVLRSVGSTTPRLAARRFNVIAWPAYAVLVVTGAWYVDTERDQIHGRYATTLAVKVVLVAVSGLAAFAHARVRKPSMMAIFGALSGLSALAALFVGVLLDGSSNLRAQSASGHVTVATPSYSAPQGLGSPFA